MNSKLRIPLCWKAAPPHFRVETNEAELRRIRETYKLERDYILALGSIQPRKNLARLIRAYSTLQNKSNKLPELVIAGKRGWLEAETMRAAEQSRARNNIRFIGYVPENDLPPLFTAATCFVYPSYFEGFGLPVVEAMQCGTPVIAGNRTSLPEVVGEAAVLVDPFDENAIARALSDLIHNPDYRTSLSTKGLERAKTFSWANTARLTLHAYERACQK